MITSRRRASALGLIAIAALACGEDAGRGGRTTVDSAGSTVVTSTVSVWGDSAKWSIDSTPLVVIGDPTHAAAALLIDIVGVRLLDDGRLALVSNDEKAILYFDRSGLPVGRAGSRGNGAGEFQQTTLISAPSDSILIWDHELDRGTMFSPGGRPVRTFALTGDSGSRYGFAPAARLENGELLVAARIGATLREHTGVRREPVPLRRASATGAVGQLLIVVPGNEQLVVSTTQHVSAMERPFGRRTLIGTSGDDVLIATGERDEVMVVRPQGRRMLIWRINRPGRLVDSMDRARQMVRYRAQAAQLPPEFSGPMLRAIAEAGFPTELPPYDQLLVDATGATWLREDVGPIHRDISPQHWTIFDRKGRWLGEVTSPAGLVVHQVTRDRVVGIWTDEDGVQQVHIHTLRR
ncbi:MAG: hypothetical protein ABIR59_13910 [Gemmatimonadales bacterium]